MAQQQLTDQFTADNYTDAAAVGPFGDVVQLRFTGYNQPFVVQLAVYGPDKAAQPTWADAEYVYAPDSGDVFSEGVAGARFRSYLAGSPAEIYAILACKGDPIAAPVPPPTPKTAPKPGSPFSILDQHHHFGTAGTPEHLHSTQPCSGIAVHAFAANVGPVYVGNAAVLPSNGYELDPGEPVAFQVGNAADVWIAVANTGDGVSWMVVG